MIEIYPEIVKSESQCPRCSELQNSGGALYFQGIHVLSNCTCQACGLEYYATLPSGHSSLFPVSFTLDKNYQQFDKENASWMAIPLLASIGDNLSVEGNFQIYNQGEGKELILINCLDDCFGHVFTKVWNVYLENGNHPESTIAVLIPEQCKWLLPSNGVEIWTVNLTLSQIQFGIKGLDAWVKSQFSRFGKVYLHPTPIHQNHQRLDFREILGVEPFNLDQFNSSTPLITFVWRDDRFWLANRFLYFLRKLSRKFNVEKLFAPLFIWRQAHLLKKLIKKIKQKLPSANFSITGLGKSGNFPAFIKDERNSVIDLQVEDKWNHIYRKSHVIIGVHGSHMLIPSALAAGFIEILPRYKIDHLTEDIAQSHNSRLSHFLGRFVDEYAGSGLISRHVVSMVKKFDFVKRNIESV